MPTRQQRQQHLAAVERIRGAKARCELETTALALWEAQRAAKSATG
jgi:hypothetical protein